MSADAIVECPRCGEQALREWWELGIWNPAKHHYQKIGPDKFQLMVHYHSRCRDCDWSHEYDYEEDV